MLIVSFVYCNHLCTCTLCTLFWFVSVFSNVMNFIARYLPHRRTDTCTAHVNIIPPKKTSCLSDLRYYRPQDGAGYRRGNRRKCLWDVRIESTSEVENIKIMQSVFDPDGDYCQNEVYNEVQHDICVWLERCPYRRGVGYRAEDPASGFNPDHTW